MHSPVQAVIFDFDGTLVDTFPAILSGWNAALKPVLGRIYSTDELIARFGPSEQGMLERELSHVSPQTMHRAVEEFHLAYQTFHAEIFAFEGITQLLEELKKRALPLAIMTGKGRRTADISLAHLGWTELFPVVVTGTEIPRAKPAPDGPLHAARLLGIAPENCVYVGDSPADLGAARAARMKPVVAGWHGYFRAQLLEMQPEFWADAPRDVLRFLD